MTAVFSLIVCGLQTTAIEWLGYHNSVSPAQEYLDCFEELLFKYAELEEMRLPGKMNPATDVTGLVN